MRRHAALVVLIVLLASAAAFALAAPAPRTSVTISNRAFSPPTVTINVGDTVVWTNNDDMDHQVSADNGSFDSGKLKRGKTFSFRFARPGSYKYSCDLHPRERGTIIVRTAPPPRRPSI